MFKHSLKAMVVAATLALTGTAQAATVNYAVGSGWTAFGFGAVGTSAKSDYNLTITQWTAITIVDSFWAGDQFDVFANGSSLGTTSAPGTGGTRTGYNFDIPATDGIHSVGRFILGPGSYLISLNVLARSGTDTKVHLGGFRADIAQVPVPAAGALLLGALGALALRRRRRPV